MLGISTSDMVRTAAEEVQRYEQAFWQTPEALPMTNLRLTMLDPNLPTIRTNL
jgi:hypothetical protein